MCNTNIFCKKPYLSLMSFDSIVFIVVTAAEGTTGNVACFVRILFYCTGKIHVVRGGFFVC